VETRHSVCDFERHLQSDGLGIRGLGGKLDIDDGMYVSGYAFFVAQAYPFDTRVARANVAPQRHFLAPRQVLLSKDQRLALDSQLHLQRAVKVNEWRLTRRARPSIDECPLFHLVHAKPCAQVEKGSITRALTLAPYNSQVCVPGLAVFGGNIRHA